MNKFRYFIWFCGLLLVGCTGNTLKDWTVSQQNDKVVWADDGSNVAIANLRFEEKSAGLLSNTTDKRRFQHQIIIQNLEGSEQRTITDWREYQNGQLFYMKRMGYFVVESLLENGARRFDKIAKNGHEILIIETPDKENQPCPELKKIPSSDESPLPAQIHHTVIPSPNGQQLAHIYSPECQKVTVEFLHANNLNLFDTQTMDIDEPMNVTWHPEGYIIFVNHNQDKAWKVTPLAPPMLVVPPKCISPVTTSSNISLDGKRVYFEGAQLATQDVGPQKAFGCQ